MKRTLSGLVLLLSAFGSANAALISRAGGQAYYDDVLDITWLANANLAATNTFGITGIDASGRMDWWRANGWILAMNRANYLGANNWRLPTVTDTGTPGCDYAVTGTECGYNVNLSTSEMAHMFYSTLGNVGLFDTSGRPTGCNCLTNTGPFANLKDWTYWSGTNYAPYPESDAWVFDFGNGGQDYFDKNDRDYAWAVSPGDSLAVVPVPGAVWMLGSALGVLGLVRRKAPAGLSA